jgi:hypothetical protein
LSDKSVNRVRAILVIFILAMAILAFIGPAEAQTASASSVSTAMGPSFGSSGTSAGGSGSSIGWVQEYKGILARGLDPWGHCFVGYEVGRVPLYSSGYYGYGPWRRPP